MANCKIWLVRLKNVRWFWFGENETEGGLTVAVFKYGKDRFTEE